MPDTICSTRLGTIDCVIVAAYLVLVFAIGIWMEQRAGKDIESYFLGGRTMPWWILGASSSSTFFDITGTMWMVSVFVALGMKGLWVHWFWAFPFAGFVLAYKAKWGYRSHVLTGMEWLVFRYGSGRAGQAVRVISALVMVIVLIMMLGYAGTGVGKFMEVFLPFEKAQMVPVLFAFTGLYVLLGGFFSVVYSDLFQTVLLSFAAVYIAVAAFFQIDPEQFRQTAGPGWFDMMPAWQLEKPPEGYKDTFGLLVVLWMTKGICNLFAASGGGAEFQRYSAARGEAEASKIGLAWGVTVSVRWSLVMGITTFGLTRLGAEVMATDTERVLPLVLGTVLPVGVKGLVIAGLMAAFMSTFDSTVNVAASFVVNDLVRPAWKTASNRSLMYVSYAATCVIVLLGILISLRTDNIRDIWNPINFALGGAVIAPAVLAPYWWRLGGWAHCLSGAVTLPCAVAVYLSSWRDRELYYFPVLLGISFLTTIVAGCLFPPAPRESLANYYRKVRPFGLWGPVRQMLRECGEDTSRPPQDRYDIPTAVVGTVFFVFLYMLMMDVVVHHWTRVGWTAAVCAACGVFLYIAWWRRLPSETVR